MWEEDIEALARLQDTASKGACRQACALADSMHVSVDVLECVKDLQSLLDRAIDQLARPRAAERAVERFWCAHPHCMLSFYAALRFLYGGL